VTEASVTPDRLDLPFADPLVERLFPPLASGVQWGLHRTERALASLGDPHRGYRTLHIGGTNGKGSVTSTLASILEADGRRTGSYTSPHLCSFRERMLVDGRPLSEGRLIEYADEIRDAVSTFGLTLFEAATVLSMHAFAQEGVEVAVMEVGLGGRLDSTNVVTPEVSAVTNVAMDHADYLGDSIAAIAKEKAGIMKRGVPFVTAETDPDVQVLFRTLASSSGTPMFVLDPTSIQDIDVARDHTGLRLESAVWGPLDLRTPLVGLHQATNAALTVRILEHLSDELRPAAASIRDGMASVVYHGRDEIARIDGHTWLFDVAHNTAGILSLVDTIDRLDLPRPLVAVIGVLGDKDWRTMLPALLSRMDYAFLTQPPSAPLARRWNPAEAADEVDAISVVRVVEDFDQALERAAERAGRGTVVVTGSVHTVGSAMSRLGLDPLGS
jgi:dihydrofolate synthase/folylpolyglutamate synthase